MKLFVTAVAFALAALAECAVNDRGPVVFPVTCECPDEDNPVCGTDIKTYNSVCSMKCADPTLEVYHQGACMYGCACLHWLDTPVCGVDGKEYPSACEARCSGMEIDKTWESCNKSDNKRNALIRKLGSASRFRQQLW